MVPRPGANREGIGGREERPLFAVSSGEDALPGGSESSIVVCRVNRNLVNDNGTPSPGFLKVLILGKFKWSGMNTCETVDSREVA
jgi:hypothetical protein